MRKGFSLLELIFVIVILSVVVTISSEIIVQVYKSYLIERSVHRGSVKTEIASNEIANRLSNSIPDTIIARKADGSFLPLEDVPAGTTDYITLQWIGSDEDSFSSMATGDTRPGWSGFVDLNSSEKNKMVSLGSDLTLANSVISNISKTKTITSAVIFFPEQFTPYNIGYNGNTDGLSKITGISGSEISLNDVTERVMKDIYRLSWSSYAVVPENCANEVCDLFLKYNFQPWNGESYKEAKSQLIMKNVTSFKFIGTGSTIRFKICMKEFTGTYETVVCKEKAVIR